MGGAKVFTVSALTERHADRQIVPKAVQVNNRRCYAHLDVAKKQRTHLPAFQSAAANASTSP